MTTKEIQAKLFSLQDKTYASLQAKILPSVQSSTIIGVRTPLLRTFAKELFLKNDFQTFIQDLPHKYFEENQLHAFIISLTKDFASCIEQTQAFLPYIDNWATCDQFSPKIFKKESEKLLPHIDQWLKSEKTYTVRFAIGMLMQHFLADNFNLKYTDLVADLRSQEYYINMMRAWYFATALAKQYESALPYLEQKRLDPWTHNKSIQKAIESLRLSPLQKSYLRTLKVKF